MCHGCDVRVWIVVVSRGFQEALLSVFYSLYFHLALFAELCEEEIFAD